MTGSSSSKCQSFWSGRIPFVFGGSWSALLPVPIHTQFYSSLFLLLCHCQWCCWSNSISNRHLWFGFFQFCGWIHQKIHLNAMCFWRSSFDSLECCVLNTLLFYVVLVLTVEKNVWCLKRNGFSFPTTYYVHCTYLYNICVYAIQIKIIKQNKCENFHIWNRFMTDNDLISLNEIILRSIKLVGNEHWAF